MNIATDPKIQDVQISADEITARLADGRVISVPLAWSWRLLGPGDSRKPRPKQRSNFRLIGSGQGIHWPDVDEDISVEGMLHGIPAQRPRPRSDDRGNQDRRRRASARSRSAAAGGAPESPADVRRGGRWLDTIDD